ncbi:hypothetical protein PC121_g13069 [Phytophthora cactorum]|nr:hypothetical protein PC120_g5874 [Phytophthora cactorum]KAG3061305.1 hypothetical protein PC121_g13069 [Phytophthora cactorum]
MRGAQTLATQLRGVGAVQQRWCLGQRQMALGRLYGSKALASELLVVIALASERHLLAHLQGMDNNDYCDEDAVV